MPAIEEIEAQYPDGWVLIVNPLTDDNSAVLAGEVAYHTPVRAEMHNKIMELRPADFAVRCFKKWPEGMAFVL